MAVLATAIVVGSGSFYGGMTYARSNRGGDFANLTAEERQARIGQFGMRGGMRGADTGARTAGDFANGEIISKDDKSITIKMRDGVSGQGGSKLIFLSGTTEIGKFTSGVSADLVTGKTVTVTGKANPDGSITATSIQIRPAFISPSPTPSK